MPRRTNSDAIREAEINIGQLTERAENLRRDIDRIDLGYQNLMERMHDLFLQIAVLQEFKKLQEEKEKRNWLLWVAVVGSLLTLAANIVLLLLRR